MELIIIMIIVAIIGWIAYKILDSIDCGLLKNKNTGYYTKVSCLDRMALWCARKGIL